MKKYLKLTSGEAIRFFILKDKTLAPEAENEIDFKLNDLEELKSELCVTIVMPTHHTHPDSDKDVILLKNLVNETEKELNERYDKRLAAKLIENIKEAHNTVDHRYNIESLVLFANENFASVVKLPVEVTTEIMIGKDFDLRPLYKTRQQNRWYYILTISRNRIRLMQAMNDKMMDEVQNSDFPFVNVEYHVSDEIKLAQDSFIDNQIKEYFNTADKRFQTYYNQNPLPVVLLGDVKMTAYYEEQMDSECMIMGHLEGSFDTIPCHEIIKKVVPVLEEYRSDKQKEFLDQIDAAQSAALVTTDLNEMYHTAQEGRADTLFIGNNYNLSGDIVNEELEDYQHDTNVIKENELLHVLMKDVTANSGNVWFMDDELLEPYNGIVMVRRF